jgi:hypothetical protein
MQLTVINAAARELGEVVAATAEVARTLPLRNLVLI